MGGLLKALISSLYELTQIPPLHKPPMRARNLHGARDPGVAGELHSNSGVRLSRVDGGLHNHEPLPRGPPDSDLQVGGERQNFLARRDGTLTRTVPGYITYFKAPKQLAS